MKATGIVRRIDDLGRIVIPKEIRRDLFHSNAEGEPMEIWLDKDKIILKKYVNDENDNEECSKKDCLTCPHKNICHNKTYEDGLNDMYELAQKLALDSSFGGFSCEEMKEIFGYETLDEVFSEYVAEEVYQKYLAFQDSIKVGDIITDLKETTRILVTEVSPHYANGIKVTPDDELGKMGAVYTAIELKNYRKTGDSVDILRILNNL